MESETDSITEILGGRVNHAEWVLLLKLYRKICANGGIIFGGAVRDYVKRTLAAQKYEEFCILHGREPRLGIEWHDACPAKAATRAGSAHQGCASGKIAQRGMGSILGCGRGRASLARGHEQTVRHQHQH